MDMDGKVLLEDLHGVNVAPLSSKVYLDWPLKKLTDAGAADTSRVFISADLMGADVAIARNIAYLAPTKEVHLKPAALKVEIGPFTSTDIHFPHVIGVSDVSALPKYSVRISSPVLARSVYLSFGNLDVQLSDNYFDILPGETAEVSVNSKASLEELKSQMKVVSLTDAFAATPQADAVSAAH